LLCRSKGLPFPCLDFRNDCGDRGAVIADSAVVGQPEDVRTGEAVDGGVKEPVPLTTKFCGIGQQP